MRKNPEKRIGSGENDALEVKKQRFFVVSWFSRQIIEICNTRLAYKLGMG